MGTLLLNGFSLSRNTEFKIQTQVTYQHTSPDRHESLHGCFFPLHHISLLRGVSVKAYVYPASTLLSYGG